MQKSVLRSLLMSYQNDIDKDVNAFLRDMAQVWLKG